MSNVQFFQKVTGLMAMGKITKQQHDWLNKQRNSKDIQEIIDMFGGHLI